MKSYPLQIGTMLSEWYSPNAPRLLQAAGLDYLLVDCEHGAYDDSAMSAMAATAMACGFPLIVRVPKADRAYILKYLEMGAAGILLPMVQTARQAEQLVEYAKYAPVGNRGISTRRSHNGYDATDMLGYFQTANERIQLFVQIETKQAVAHLEEIAAVPGLSGLVVGPNDLTADFGDFGNYESPRLWDAVEEVVHVAQDRGLRSGSISSNAGLLKKCIGLGMDWINWSSELSIIYNVARREAADLRAR